MNEQTDDAPELGSLAKTAESPTITDMEAGESDVYQMPELSPIHTLLECSADRCGDAVALEHDDVVLTYAEVEAGANRVAARLRDLGVERGDRVGLLADNGRVYVEGFFGILKTGACCVALNGANKARTSAALLADSGSVGLVTMAARVARDLPEIVQGAPDLRFVITDRPGPAWSLPARLRLLRAEDVASASPARVTSDAGLEDLCAILYTSGSTGLPRGVTLRHRNLAANTQQILAYLKLTADDSVLSVLPFHYSFGNSLLLTHFAVGGRVVVDNRFAYPSTVVESLERSRVSGFSGVPSTYAILAAKTDFLRRSWPDLRYLTQAGGGMTAALTRRLLDEMPPHVRLFVMYGQTEASARLSYVPPGRLREKLGSIGIGIPGVTLTIRDEQGRECAPGEVGEVVAAGDNLMQGYWNAPEETALVLKEDGLHTGDLGRKDEDGFIFLVDRIKNMIKVGANRVSPREIEDVIAEVEGVAEVCVAGVPDELLGEAVEAFVVVAPGAEVSRERILAHCREYLAVLQGPARRALPGFAAAQRRRQGRAQRAGAQSLGGLSRHSRDRPLPAVGTGAEEVDEQRELPDELDRLLQEDLVGGEVPQPQPGHEQRDSRHEDAVLGLQQGRAEDDGEHTQYHRVDREHRDLGEAEVVEQLPSELEDVIEREDERERR